MASRPRVEHALQTYDPAEFPVVPSQLEGDSIEVDAAELVHAVKVTSHAVAKEPSRYTIDGILLESNEKGSRLVATDGRRLAMVELCNAGELDDQALLPHRFCRLIDKLTDRNGLDARLRLGTSSVKFNMGRIGRAHR